MRNVLDESCNLDKIKTHTLWSIPPPPENRTFLRLMLKNTVQWSRLQTTIRRMRFACWKPEATDAHSEYIPFQRKQWLRERASVLCFCALPVSYIIPVVRVKY
jgi:hypothetical protein